ncbi:Ff.00g068040.m01.CDS01 [Fusarium sp. VM40]|nr:Ff.00g068040.m01.CDS01 [Fusarium sp. VM40]
MFSNTDTADTSLSLSKTSMTTATATQLLALTTPFKQPRGCDSHWERTSILSTEGDTSTVLVLLSKAVPSCYPSGWEDVVPESRWNFNPAVCPSGWTYYDMAEDREMGVSTASCCNSGYTRLNDDDWELVAYDISTYHCGRWVQNTDELSTTSNAEAASSVSTIRTLMLHKAWSISWNASDTSTMTPKLPSLTNKMEVPVWTPGQDIPKGKYDESLVEDGPLSGVTGRFLLIGLPIIGVFFVLLGAWICFVRHKRRQRAARK